MRIAVIQRTVSRVGGTERYAWDLVRGLVQAGDDVTLLGHHLETPLPGLTFHCLKPRVPARFSNLLTMLDFLWQVRTTLKRLPSFDVLLSLDRSLDHDVLRFGGGCHAAYLETCEGWISGHPPLTRPFQLRNRLLLWLERGQLSQHCSSQDWLAPLKPTIPRQVIAVSPHVKQELLARYPFPPERILVIPNGVDLDRFGTLPPEKRFALRTSIRNQMGIPLDAPVILCVGTGAHRKGIEPLLQAFAGLFEQSHPGPSPFLLLVGRDAHRGVAKGMQTVVATTARASLSSHIRCIKQYDPIEDLYAASDIFALPTRYEPFGNVCLEALAMGLPVITTRQNGMSALLYNASSQMQALLLESPDDIPGLTVRLKRLMDPVLRAQLGNEGILIAQQNSIQKQIFAVRALLEETRLAQALPQPLPPPSSHGI